MKSGAGNFYLSEPPLGKRCPFGFKDKSNPCNYSSTLLTQGVTTPFAAEQSRLKLPADDRKLIYTTAKQV